MNTYKSRQIFKGCEREILWILQLIIIPCVLSDILSLIICEIGTCDCRRVIQRVRKKIRMKLDINANDRDDDSVEYSLR